MVFKNLAVALALASAVSAAPALKARDDDCQQTYKKCVAAGTPEVVCSCDLTTCVGEDAARIRDWCFSATASLKTASATSASATASPTFSSISGIPGGCNPAHPGSCPSSYFTHTSATATVTATSSSTFTPIPGIPGGCNPAHPGSCPSSYFTYPTLSATASPAPDASAPATPAAPADAAPAYPNPVPVEGKTWTVANLTRYCGEGNEGCDYNFAIVTPEGTERCTVIRMPGADAATESWSDQPCTNGSKFKVSWGYATEPAPPFAVMTVVDGKELAWFGVANVNEQPVTPSNPFGSGQYGSIGPQQVYTY